jgi:hypothetical protein
VAARGNVKVLRAMSTASTRKGGQERHVLIHHHADGRVSWRALAACMATLLTTPVDLTDDQKLAAYEHLAEHYRAIGVVPPAAGRKAPAEAYDLAIEGRMAHIDTAGNAWVYARALNPASAVAMPVFTRVDSNRSRTFHVPRFGLSNPSSWGRAIPNGRPAEPGSLSEVARLMI